MTACLLTTDPPAFARAAAAGDLAVDFSRSAWSLEGGASAGKARAR